MGYTNIWMEGFEHYSLDQSGDVFGDVSNLTEGLWAEATGSAKIVSTLPRTGTYSFEALDSLYTLRRSLKDEYLRVGVQFAHWMSNLPSNVANGMVLGQFRDSDNKGLIGIQIGTTGRVRVMKGGLDGNSQAVNAVLLAESTLELAAGAWNHFEVKVFLDDTVGYVKVRVQGRDWVSYTGNTSGGHSGTAGDAAQVAFGSFDGTIAGPGIVTERLDDIAAGTWEDTDDAVFLGQYGVYYQKPNADTAVADWLLTTGVHGYALIDEVTPDDNTNYVFTSTVNGKSRWAVEPLPANIVSVAAVAPIARLRKTDTGDCSVNVGVFSGSTEDLAATDHDLVTSFDWYWDTWMLDPDTNDVWNPLFLPSIQVKRTE